MAAPPTPPIREVVVRLGSAEARAYSVMVGEGLVGSLGGRVRAALGRAEAAKAGRAFLVVDDGLPSLTIEMATGSLRAAGWRVELASVHATEEGRGGKSLETVGRLLTHMAAARRERAEPVVALGGGIVGDVAGFAASIYRRGVPVVQCPTTLLAMVDASVGGKTGVNIAVPLAGGVEVLRKNMVGTFHQPSLVVCDVAVLDSLADDELASGLAECVKHGLIGGDWGDAGLMEWTCANGAKFLQHDRAALAELVARNVAIKAQVVAGDEREERVDGRGRMALNMGHTVGHAIETMEVHGVARGRVRAECGLKHGEAVALGLIAEAAIGEAMGVTRVGLAIELRGVLEGLGLPTEVRGIGSVGDVRDAMLDDKKVGAGKIRLAVPTGRGAGGGCEVVAPDSGALGAGIATIESRI